LKNGKFLALKKYCQNTLAKFLQNSDFWQHLPNLAPSGNPGVCDKTGIKP